MNQSSFEIAIQMSKRISRRILAHSLLIRQTQHQAAISHQKWQVKTKILGELLNQNEALTSDAVDVLEQFMVQSRLIRAYTECAEDYLKDLQYQAKANQHRFSVIYEDDEVTGFGLLTMDSQVARKHD